MKKIMLLALCATLSLGAVAPAFQARVQDVDLAVWDASYSACYKQFGHLPLDIAQLHEQYKVLKLTFTNNGAVRYMIHNRTIDLPIADFALNAQQEHNSRWYKLTAAEIAAQGLLAMACFSSLRSSYFYSSNYEYTPLGRLGKNIKTAVVVGSLLTIKDSLVGALRKRAKTSAKNLLTIQEYFAQEALLKAYHILEPGKTITKTILVRKEDYNEKFLVRIASHDYTVAAHTLDFEIDMHTEE